VTPEIRVDCPEELKFVLVAAMVKRFRATHDVIDIDGVRINFGDGWGLIRASNTQPALVFRFEAKTRERLREIINEVKGALEEDYPGIKLPDGLEDQVN